jgi:hypothetical protein
VEPLDDNASIRLDHPLGWDVVDLGRELDVCETFSFRLRQQ